MSIENQSVSQIWSATVDQAKKRINNRTLWAVLEQSVGIIIEDGIFIIGLKSSDMNNAGYMQTPEHKNVLESTVSQLANQVLRIRVIEGESAEDWSVQKQRDERIANLKATTFDRRDKLEADTQSWDTIYDYAAKSYSAMQARQLPQMKARYLEQMLKVISEAMTELYSDKADEQTERLLARVIDRVASNAEVPSTIFAMELERIRTAHNKNAN